LGVSLIPSDVIRGLREQGALLIDIATGKQTISVVNDDYRERRDALRPALESYMVDDPFPWRDLWAYWADEAKPLATWSARITALNGRLDVAEGALLRLQHGGPLTDWSADEPAPTSWAEVVGRQTAMKEKFRAAVETDDFMDVARRCRELIIDAAALVHRPWMVPFGEEAPKSADAKAKFDHICATVLRGAAHERLRKLLRAALEMAHETTHSKSAGRLQMLATAQSTVVVVSVLREIDRTVDAMAPGAASAEAPSPPDVDVFEISDEELSERYDEWLLTQDSVGRTEHELDQ
jgi:hypothetical protein